MPPALNASKTAVYFCNHGEIAEEKEMRDLELLLIKY